MVLLQFLAGKTILAGAASAAADERFQVGSWHLEAGLPDPTVTCLAQTSDGYLWVGTPRGLARFDGKTFNVVAGGAGVKETLVVGALLADKAGGLWLAGPAGSLWRLDAGRLVRVHGGSQVGHRVRAGFLEEDAHSNEPGVRWMWGQGPDLAEDAAGDVWMHHPGVGILCWQRQTGQVVVRTNGLPATEVAAFGVDLAGQVWSIALGGLYRFGKGEWNLVGEGEALNGAAPRLALAREGGIWIVTPRGTWIHGGGVIRRFSDGQWFDGVQATPWMPNSLRSQVTCSYEDRMGRLWIGTMWGGVYCSDKTGKWDAVTRDGSFSRSVITCLFEDNQGGIWVGTVGDGLHRIWRQPVTVLTLPEPARENIVTASCIGQDQSLWIGTDGAGVFRHKEGVFQHFGSEQGVTNLHVCSLLEDRRTNLWAGTWGGLLRLNHGRFELVNSSAVVGLSVLVLFESRLGDLWIGTPHGPVRMRDGSFEVHEVGSGKGEVDIRAIAEDPLGGLWVGTIGRGLFYLKSGSGNRLEPVRNFPSRNARALYCDSDGVLWVGSDGAGLFRMLNGAFVDYSSADGLPSDTLSSITPDRDGNLWLGSDNGIFACAPAQLRSFTRGQGTVLLMHRLSIGDGLLSRGCSGGGQPVTAQASDGRLWFPNMRGLASFDPRTVRGELRPPTALVESVLGDGVPLELDAAGRIRAPSTTRRYEFHFTAPELNAPDLLRFRHRLEGMDSGWVDARGQRVAHYSQLPPGDYLLRLMVVGADGQWREGASVLSLKVVPRWWEHRWVRMSGALLVIVLLAGGFAMNERRKVRRRLERLEIQQSLEQERRRIAQDLHDDLGARMTEIVLLGELGQRGDPTVQSLREQMGRMTRKMRDLVVAVNEIVWTVNPKNDTLPRLAAYLCNHTERFLSAARLGCRLETAPDLPPWAISAQVRHNLLLSVKEVLNNSARHADARIVRLKIRLEDSTLLIVVEDDGKGFVLGDAICEEGNGLSNLRNRLQSVGGTVEIGSRPGVGTQVVLRLRMAPPEAENR